MIEIASRDEEQGGQIDGKDQESHGGKGRDRAAIVPFLTIDLFDIGIESINHERGAICAR